MKIVLLTTGHGNQRALANKLARVVDIAAIVISANVPRRQKPPAERAELLLRRIESRLFARPFVDAWLGMQRHYDQRWPRLPATRVLRVQNVNDRETLALLDDLNPDVVAVSGTNLVGKGIIERANRRRGIVNLHTGISPYVKGGPNCTNWCLAKGWFYLIGSTMMWLDIGIDTGDIICTERTPLDGSESIADLHLKVMDHAHDMYVRTLAALAANRSVPRVRQSTIAPGTTFYNRDWNALQMLKARQNHRTHFRRAFESGSADREASAIRLVSLGEASSKEAPGP